MTLLKVGSKGDDVKTLQDQLKAAGYDTGASDGIYGPKTEAAVKAYQTANNLTVDGIVGNQTLGSLNAPKPATAATSSPVATTTTTPTPNPILNTAAEKNGTTVPTVIGTTNPILGTAAQKSNAATSLGPYTGGTPTPTSIGVSTGNSNPTPLGVNSSISTTTPASTSINTATDNTDFSTLINQGIANNASVEDIKYWQEQRRAKIKSNPSLAQYAYDETDTAATNYINSASNKISEMDQMMMDTQKIISDYYANQKPVDWENIYNDMLSRLPESQALNVLSWQDAVLQAQQQVNPQFDQANQNLSKALDYNNIRSGFYGQKPGDALKQENLSSQENARIQAINNLATQLQGLSRTDADRVAQADQFKRQEALNLLTGAYNSANSQNNQQLNNLWSLVDMYRNNRNDLKEEQRYQQEWSATQSLNELKTKGYVLDNESKELQNKASNLDIRIKEINLEALPAQIKKSLEEQQAKINSAKSAAEADKAIADMNMTLKAIEIDTKLTDLDKKYKDSNNTDINGQTYTALKKDIMDLVNEKTNVTTTDPETYLPITSSEQRYSWADIVNIIKGMSISQEWKDRLISDTGVGYKASN